MTQHQRIDYVCDNCGKTFAEGETQDVTIAIGKTKPVTLDICVKDCLPKLQTLARRPAEPVPSLRRSRGRTAKAAATPAKKTASKT